MFERLQFDTNAEHASQEVATPFYFHRRDGMETSVRKVRVLQNDGRSQLIRVEDEHGNDFFIPRSRVHMVGDQAYITSERQADIMRRAEARRAKREALRLAKEKLTREAKAPESKSQNEVAA
jgi:hypothetical protein